MNRHTPGPWTAYCRDVSHKEGEPWSKENFLQWEVSGPEVPDGRGEFYEADARLVAAAPDMLAALNFLNQCSAPMTGQQEECWKLVRSAIAKATGELFNTGDQR